VRNLIKGDVCFAFLDLKVAFDLIPRQVIWEALAEINVPEALTQTIEYIHRSERSSEN
jgi:hypothetical protein